MVVYYFFFVKKQTVFLFFSGAEKRGKRDIHPHPSSPYMGRLNRSFSSLVH